MPSKISKKRLAAFNKQSGCCYYCGNPMWEDDPQEFAIAHNISKKYAARFQCTAEHLLARCDGGKDEERNIVAACTFCNSKRHQRKNPLNPPEFRAHIQRRLKKGKWHPITSGY